MGNRISFFETPNGAVVIHHAEPEEIADEPRCAKTRARLSLVLGGLEVVSRCQFGEQVICRGPQHLHRYAQDPTVDVRAVVRIDVDSPATHAA